MGVILPNSIFFHIPKTGGTWVDVSLEKAFPDSYIKMNLDFGFPADITGIHIPRSKVKLNKFSFAFVRHPLSWYKSYFRFKHLAGKEWTTYKDDGNALSKDCAADDFGEFMDNVMKYFPEGYYHTVVRENEDVDYVGKQENLHYNLCTALEMAGEEFNPDDFLAQHVNVSDKSIFTAYFKRHRDFILDKERYVIERYY